MRVTCCPLIILLGLVPTLKEAMRLPIEHLDTLRSGPGREPASIDFLNTTGNPLQIYWVDPSGDLRSFGAVPAHSLKTQETFASHVWLLGTDRSLRRSSGAG